MNNLEVEFPGIRLRIIGEVKTLKNINTQKKEWVKLNCKHTFWDNIRLNLDILMDDMPCEEDPPPAIGVVLRNYEELVYVQFLIRCLLRVIKEIGIEQRDSAYLTTLLSGMTL